MKLTGGQAVVQGLIREGVEVVFGLPGVQNDYFYNALYDYRDDIRIIHTRHEQGAGYMALGYNLASGKPGICSVVPGPGFLNSSAALATAWGLNAKVCWMVGQIPMKAQGKLKGSLHEIPDQMAIIKQFTKWAGRATSPSEIPDMVSEAFYQMRSNRPRPVGLEISMDVLQKNEEVDFSSYQIREAARPSIDFDKINEAITLLSNAKCPLIFVGGGAMEASSEVTKLAEMIQAPVFSYRTGKGIVTSKNPLSFPVPAAHQIWAQADVIVTVGSHARMPLSKWGTDKEIRLISINIDPSEHDRFVPAAVQITADAAQACRAITDLLEGTFKDRNEHIEGMRCRWTEQSAYLEPQQSWLNAIRDVLPDDGIFVDELTQAGFASRMLYQAYRPRTYLSTGFMGTLGWGFQTALGAKVARPDSPVVCVAGDGGFMFGVQELATAVHHKIGVILLLFNNNLYGNVRNMQEELYGGRVIATDLHNPDFVRMAHLFGANGVRVHSTSEMKRAIKNAIGETLPTLIEIPVSNDLPSTDQLKSLPKLRGF